MTQLILIMSLLVSGADDASSLDTSTPIEGEDGTYTTNQLTIGWTAPKLNKETCASQSDEVSINLSTTRVLIAADFHAWITSSNDCGNVPSDTSDRIVDKRFAQSTSGNHTQVVEIPYSVFYEKAREAKGVDVCETDSASVEVKVCFLFDLQESTSLQIKEPDEQVGAAEPHGWVTLTVDTLAPPAPDTPTLVSKDKNLEVTSEITAEGDSEDLRAWIVRYRPVGKTDRNSVAEQNEETAEQDTSDGEEAVSTQEENGEEDTSPSEDEEDTSNQEEDGEEDTTPGDDEENTSNQEEDGEEDTTPSGDEENTSNQEEDTGPSEDEENTSNQEEDTNPSDDEETPETSDNPGNTLPCTDWSSDEYNETSQVNSATKATIDARIENETEYEVCVFVEDKAGNRSEPSSIVRGSGIDECDFMECYPGSLKTGNCAALGPQPWILLLMSLLTFMRRRPGNTL